ncbi:MAG: protein translocase subunit SecD [Desulfomonile tiedjei]|uniref:Protein translocase subunit SecD n=1 Tax=Desulfomonile tiedjei TaxID=2358 RepID=A0A9D6Z2X5_9BACT|nr:protein translocase subunit SecD [Desulfomonile tiedjei]
MTQSLQWRIGLVAVVLVGCVFLLYPSVGPVPEFWQKYLPNNPVRLGLDLQGGLHLVLEVQSEVAVETVVDQAISEASSLMKEEKIRYNDILRTSPTTLSVFLKDGEQAALFDEKILDKLQNFKKVSSAPAEKGFEIQLQLDPKVVESTKQRAVRQAVDTIRNRVDQFGVAEPDVVMQGTDRIIVQLPGLKEDINRAIDLIKRTARLEFKLVDDKADVNAGVKGDIPPGDELLYKVDRNAKTGAISRTPYLVKKQTLMTGDVITDARVHPDKMGRMIIGMDFNHTGAVQFERITGEHVREHLAIILDNRVYSAPVIKDRISGGSAIIEGMFSPEEAHDLALVLRAGSLPAPVKILENRSVGPSLGEDSIRSGRDAILFGIILIVIGMAVYYKWSGVVADVALVLNPLLLFAVMVSPGLRATLTLPGLAGVALTMGMAIDANILIFERVREELRFGKSPRAAMETGYNKAFLTIIDTHLTNIIAALPLIQFGTGPVKGFAVTLCVGLIISLFTAFFVTRTIFDFGFQVKRIKRLSI